MAPWYLQKTYMHSASMPFNAVIVACLDIKGIIFVISGAAIVSRTSPQEKIKCCLWIVVKAHPHLYDMTMPFLCKRKVNLSHLWLWQAVLQHRPNPFSPSGRSWQYVLLHRQILHCQQQIRLLKLDIQHFCVHNVVWLSVKLIKFSAICNGRISKYAHMGGGQRKVCIQTRKREPIKGSIAFNTVIIKTEMGLMFAQYCVHRFCLSLRGIFSCGIVGVVEDRG